MLHKLTFQVFRNFMFCRWVSNSRRFGGQKQLHLQDQGLLHNEDDSVMTLRNVGNYSSNVIVQHPT